MKTLIAVISYYKDAMNGSHQAIRETWGKNVSSVGADLRFFIGRRDKEFSSAADEVLVHQLPKPICGHDPSIAVENCCEDYMQHEVREVLRWSLLAGYDFTFLPSTDTFLIPRKLMASGFENYDYSGFFTPPHLPVGIKSSEDIYGRKLYPWADAGVGWFMSKKASEIIVRDVPDFWTDDIHVGQMLGPFIESGKITAKTLDNFWNEISWHYRWVTGKGYKPSSGWMQEMWSKYGDHSGV